MELVHSRVGGSGAHRFWECPGCINLADKVKAMPDYEPKTSIYATEGTVAHTLGELCLKNGDEYADGYVGESFLADDKFITVTQNMADAVQVYLDDVRGTVKDEFGTNMSFLEVEKKFALPNVDPDAFGTNDACLHVPFHKLIIWDYKHGKGVVVEVKFNKQLLYYALGALGNMKDVEEVELRLVQPRAAHKDGFIRKASYPVEKLALFEMELKQKIEATKDPEAPRKGGDWCKFCEGYRICSEAKKDLWRGNRSNNVADAIDDFN